MKKFILSLSFLLITQNLFSTTLYVDSAATGLNNGTSWANAWTNFNAINYSVVNGGDIIYISQGNYGYLNPSKGGTTNNPITFKVSQEVGRNGGITNSGMSFSYSYITADGALSDTYAASYMTSTIAVLTMSNNIGWKIIRTNTANVDGGATCVNLSSRATNSVKIKWIEMYQLSDHQEDYGVRFNVSSPYRYKSNEVAYCWIHNIGQDGIKNLGSGASWFDAIVVHHNLIEKTGDDGLEINTGFTVACNIIRDARDEIGRGHPDGIAGQTMGWSKYYNNIIWGFKRSQNFYPTTLVQITTNLWIYGNLVYWGDTNTAETVKTMGSVGMEDGYWNPTYGHVPGTSDTNIYWQNLRILNNTFAAYAPYAVTPYAFFNRYKTGSSNAIVCTIWVTNGYVANNIFYYGVGSGFSIASKIDAGTNTMKLYNNLAWSTNAAGKSFGTSDGSWATGELMDAATGFTGNSSVQPTFEGAGNPNWDYRLATNDVGAKDMGTNLTSFASEMPGLNVDIWGNSRGLNGTWDIGANEYVESTPPTPEPSGLLVWLRFTNDFSLNGGTLTDSSGIGNHFIRTGVIGTSYPSNFLTSISSTNYSGVYTGAAALAWEYYIQPPDNRAEFENGTWGALTNINSFTNMPLMSFAFWAAMDPNRNNYSATVLSAGLNGVGTWSVGRYFSYSPTNTMKWVVTTNYAGGGDWDRERIEWPNSLSGWHHYAGTFSNGVCRIYLDGELISTTTLPISSLTVTPEISREDTQQSYMPWIGVGCQTHNGNPYIADWTNATDYPNNGWWSGGIGSVRIYNTVLSATEIQTIYNSEISGEPVAPSNLNIIQQLRVENVIFR